MKKLHAAATALAVALLASACGGGANGSLQTDTIKIGAWFPLSGAQAASGTPQMEGVAAFWKKVNAEGGINGKKVEFIYKDNAFDPQQTLQIARELVSKEEVDVIANANGTAVTEATFPLLLQQNKIPVYGTYGGLGAWYAPPRDLLFGTMALYQDQAVVAAEWAMDEGAKKITVVHDDPDAFVNVKDAAVKAITAGGKAATNVEVKIGTTDYGPVLAQVKRQNPDAVLLILPPQEAAAYLNEAALQQFDAQVYAYAPAAMEATIKLAGKNAEGMRGVALTKPTTSDDEAVREYVETLKTYGDGAEPNLNSLAAYGYAKSFGEILKTINGDVNKESIAKAIASAQNIQTGIVPPLSFSGDQHLGTSAVVKVEVENGLFVAKGDFASPKN